MSVEDPELDDLFRMPACHMAHEACHSPHPHGLCHERFTRTDDDGSGLAITLRNELDRRTVIQFDVDHERRRG